MNEEMIKIFDESRTEIGISSRKNVHEKGLWHETFHCWCIQKVDGIDCIYIQIRSDSKNDYPNLLDITTAGHLLANETVHDGIREVKEELGIDILFEDLESLGIIEDCIVTKQLIDKEFCHVYLYRFTDTKVSFKLQEEEVSGIVKTQFNNFYDFCVGNSHVMPVSGYVINESGNQVAISKKVTKKDFVPHQDTYFKNIAQRIKELL
ncbi:NUDIX hydrolase [Bacillus massiliigorillae]|uniref:NUDIX hydrolase n=1 Tax=Bacillus massiliigorillae TaxID=1243664 RepID=UPI00039CEB88|nr:NUDIX hydrolase [Bacillus massiliigorillae]